MNIRELIEKLTLDAVIIGVGNDISGDDAFGPVLAERLKPLFGARCINGGLAPENWVGKIIDMAPSMLIIADAVAFDGASGEIRVFTPEDLIQEMPSTHGPGFGALIGYLRQFMPNLEMWILAVEPKSVGLMTPMSAPVESAIEKISSMFEDFLSAP
ncbi:MAG TPA: hydrogenase maturation protease [candidate division Zixibacteria bacterium]|nr:hydrogenase maturation protease [candidate division Zixibacteria bacterium]